MHPRPHHVTWDETDHVTLSLSPRQGPDVHRGRGRATGKRHAASSKGKVVPRLGRYEYGTSTVRVLVLFFTTRGTFDRDASTLHPLVMGRDKSVG